MHSGVCGLWSRNIRSALSNTYWGGGGDNVTRFAFMLLKKATQMQVHNMCNDTPLKHTEVRECFLAISAEYSVFQFAIHKYME
jgi:hypothetical protein